MSSAFSDPNNHVPEVSENDTWGDDGVVSDTGVLPPRRARQIRDEAPSRSPQETGLRIESRIFEASENLPTEASGLEVQELGGVVMRLEKNLPKPERVVALPTPVANLADVEIQHRNPRGEGREWGRADGGAVRWMVMAGGVIALLVVGAFVVWSQIAENRSGRASLIDGAVEVKPEEPSVAQEETVAMLASQAHAARIFESYAKAGSAKEVLPLLREDDAKGNLIETRWQSIAAPKDWALAASSSWAVSPENGRTVGILSGSLPDYSPFQAIFVNEQGKLRLDWKATNGYGSASFEELENGEGDASEIRGILSEEDFYTADFPEAEFRSHRLLAPDGLTAIWAYTERGSAVDAKLAEIFPEGSILGKTTESHPITLRLERSPGNSRANQWIIGEMLHIGWSAP